MGDSIKKHPLLTGKEIENLPSYGVGALVADEAYVRDMMKQLSRDKKSTTKKVIGQDGLEYQVVVEETSRDALGESATEPLGTTVDTSQIMETEDNKLIPEGCSEPTLHCRITMDYTRFRYMSEKTPSKKSSGSKKRQYETSYGDDEKHCLAELRIENYEGSAKFVAFCAHEDGKLHPYHLYGDSCFNGVYVKKEHVRRGKVLKLKRVSVTTPKEKEYDKTLQDQQSYLSQAGVEDVKASKDVKDKQIVYVMFKAILDDGRILTQLSSPIQNKKKGKEFKIEDMEPSSGPATGYTGCSNVQSNRVMICVTEGTNFPAEIGVKIRERDESGRVLWEEEPQKEDIKVTKQCVVRFNPPPYQNPQTPLPVEVEICLYDVKTKIETEPVKYLYQPILDRYGLESKAKKRKLDDTIEDPRFNAAAAVRPTRKVLTGIKKGAYRDSDSQSSDQSISSQEGSLQLEEISHKGNLEAAFLVQTRTASSNQDRTVSLQAQRMQLPFSTYSDVQSVGGQEMSNSTPLQQLTTRVSLSQGPIAHSTSGNKNYFTCQSPDAITTSPSVSVSDQQQQQQQQVNDQSDVVFLNEDDMTLILQSGTQLPKLGPNQSLAIVGGQIYVVNDDTSEPSAVVPPPARVYQPPSFVQNIGNQQIIVQSIPPQQPEAEAEYLQVSMATAGAAVPSPVMGNVANLKRGTPLLGHTMQQQQQQQQQPSIQQSLLNRLLSSAGVDPSSLNDAQQQMLLQQIFNLQVQSQQQSNPGPSPAGTSINYSSNLDDDDIEIDGHDNRGSSVNNNSENDVRQQKYKKLKSSNSSISGTWGKLNQVIVEVQSNNSVNIIPTLINDSTNNCDDEQDGEEVIENHFSSSDDES